MRGLVLLVLITSCAIKPQIQKDIDYNTAPNKLITSVLDTIFLNCNIQKSFSDSIIQVYNRQFAFPYPPFIPAEKYRFTPAKFDINAPYTFCINADSSIYNPALAMQDYITPLRYITKWGEYDSLLQNTKPLQSFWNERGKTAPNALKMQTEYQKRIDIAKQQFTDYRIGWQTDLGMIFLVFGIPTEIWYLPQQQKIIWQYKNLKYIPNTQFEFAQQANPIAKGSHWALIRNPKHKTIWSLTVHQWRSGAIAQFF
jgi:GWxTD domain-containing protein